MSELKLKNVRLSFPGLFKATPFKEGDEPKFKATFLIAKDDPQIAAIEKAILDVAEAKWPKKGAAIIKSIRGNANKFCFQDGDTKDYDGYAGMMALSAKSLVRPLVINKDKSPLTQEDGKPYAGCYVNATVEIFGYSEGGNGISAGLTGVQFAKDGDSFAGAKPANPDDFDNLEDGSTEDELDDVA